MAEAWEYSTYASAMRPAFSACRPRSYVSHAEVSSQDAGASPAIRQKANDTHKMETRVRTNSRRTEPAERAGDVLSGCGTSTCAKLLGNGDDPAHSGARSDGAGRAVGDLRDHAGDRVDSPLPAAAGASRLDRSAPEPSRADPDGCAARPNPD